MNSYLFVLCPPFSGSTVLWKLLSTSDAVSALPTEGQFLPEVKDIMRAAPWNPDVRLPWETIKHVWHRYWDRDKPWLLEKSPPNLIRAKDIVRHFEPSYFLVMVRNPYAHCASLMRRLGWDATRSAEFSLRCMTCQVENAKVLKNVVRFTYEQFSGDPRSAARDIQEACPHIGTFKCDVAFAVHSSLAPIGQSVAEQRIINHNSHSVKSLSFTDRERIRAVLKQRPDSLRYWGYEESESGIDG